MVAGRRFKLFTLDLGLGDAITPPIETVQGGDCLEFCGIPPAIFKVVSLEQQLAEKIHAMTVKRGDRENTRVKDLVDSLLMINAGLDSDLLTTSDLGIDLTFEEATKRMLSYWESLWAK